MGNKIKDGLAWLGIILAVLILFGLFVTSHQFHVDVLQYIRYFEH